LKPTVVLITFISLPNASFIRATNAAYLLRNITHYKLFSPQAVTEHKAANNVLFRHRKETLLPRDCSQLPSLWTASSATNKLRASFSRCSKQLKMYFFVPYVLPCMHHNYGATRAGLKPMQPMQLHWAPRLCGTASLYLGRLFIFDRYILPLRIQ